jgi:hypothetical protein
MQSPPSPPLAGLSIRSKDTDPYTSKGRMLSAAHGTLNTFVTTFPRTIASIEQDGAGAFWSGLYGSPQAERLIHLSSLSEIRFRSHSPIDKPTFRISVHSPMQSFFVAGSACADIAISSATTLASMRAWVFILLTFVVGLWR